MNEGQLGKAYVPTLALLAAALALLVFWLTAGIGTFVVFIGVLLMSVGALTVLNLVLRVLRPVRR